MQGTDVLLSLAEIAGVFVGFGALIAVRSGGPSQARDVAYIRSVLTIGVWVVVAGLVPATLGGYDLNDHDVWSASSLIALVSILAIWVMNYRTPEMRDVRASLSRASLSLAQALETAGYASLVVLIVAALASVILGLFPEQEPALYLTAVVLGLFAAALSLLWLVFAQHRPVTPSDGAERPVE